MGMSSFRRLGRHERSGMQRLQTIVSIVAPVLCDGSMPCIGRINGQADVRLRGGARRMKGMGLRWTDGLSLVVVSVLSVCS